MLGWEGVANSLWGIKTSWRKGVALRQMEDVCEAVLFGRGRRKTCLLFNKKLQNGFLIIFLFTPPLCNFLLISWIADWKWLFHPWGIPRELSNAGLFSEAVGERAGTGGGEEDGMGQKKKKPTHIPWWLRQYRLWMQCRRCGFDPSVRKIPWRSKGQPIPGFLPGEFHGQRSLVGNSPWVAKSQTWLSN